MTNEIALRGEYLGLVEKILQNKVIIGRNIYEIGLSLKAIRDRKLYLFDDLPIMENFEEFLNKKVGIAKRTAYTFIRISEQFNLRDFEKWGLTKLDMLLTALPDESLRSHYLSENVPLPAQKLKDSITSFKSQKGIENLKESLKRDRILREPSQNSAEETIYKMQHDADWLINLIILFHENRKNLEFKLKEFENKYKELSGGTEFIKKINTEYQKK